MIPNDIEKRKQYYELIERGVQLKREQETLKEDMAQLRAEVEEEIGKDFAKEYNTKVRIQFDMEKVHTEAKAKLEIIEELDILKRVFNGGNF